MARNRSVAEPFVQTLISAERNINLADWEISSQELGLPGLWSIRQRSLHGGKQEGTQAIIIDNGKLQITLIPTRGMGILSVTMGDVRLGWESPVKEVVHPRHINLQSRGGLGWLEGFNEWLVRCGLENCGAPGTDNFINNNGDPASMELTLHGKIANIPASQVEVVIQRAAPYRLSVRGRVDERMMFGPKLELWSEISAEPGSSSFRVTDAVTNRGDLEQEFQLLYHCNFGAPLPEEGGSFLLPTDRVFPINACAAKAIGTYDQFAGPHRGFVEQVYCFHPLADSDRKTIALLRNRSQDRAVSIEYSTADLPYLTLWKNTSSLPEGYVAGIEPATGFPYNRRIERQAGRVPKLAGGASRRATLDFTIHAGQEQVNQAAGRIEKIQAGRKPVIEKEPPKV